MTSIYTLIEISNSASMHAFPRVEDPPLVSSEGVPIRRWRSLPSSCFGSNLAPCHLHKHRNRSMSRSKITIMLVSLCIVEDEMSRLSLLRRIYIYIYTDGINGKEKQEKFQTLLNRASTFFSKFLSSETKMVAAYHTHPLQ